MKITRELKQKAAKIARKHHLSLMIIFGSQAQGKIHPKSDIDIAVLPAKTIKDVSMKIYSDFLGDMGKIFPGAKVDIALIPLADPFLLDNIAKSGQLLFGKKIDFVKFQLRAFNRFQDYLPYFKLEEKSVHSLIRQF